MARRLLFLHVTLGALFSGIRAYRLQDISFINEDRSYVREVS
jgi:hypothetical protein